MNGKLGKARVDVQDGRADGKVKMKPKPLRYARDNTQIVIGCQMQPTTNTGAS